MKKKNVAMETDSWSIKKHDITIWDFKMVDDDKNLGIFTLDSGVIAVRDCRCFYTPGGDFQIRFPPSVDYSAEVPFETHEFPYHRIKKLLLAHIESVKANHTFW
jgi:hypothetical protein